jgi:hypothetical protein
MGWFHQLFKKEEQKPVDISVMLPEYKVRLKLIEIWPELNPKLNSGRLNVADVLYVMPSEKEVKKMLFDSQIDSYVHTAHTISPISGLLDCDDFALLLHAHVVKTRYNDFKAGKIPKSQLYPLAFGQIWYIDPKIGFHAINICITHDKGVLLIEPQNDKIWKAKKGTVVKLVRI